jgi:hypothetical protein
VSHAFGGQVLDLPAAGQVTDPCRGEAEETLLITSIDSVFVMDTVWMIGNDTIFFGDLTITNQEDLDIFGQADIRHLVGVLTKPIRSPSGYSLTIASSNT